MTFAPLLLALAFAPTQDKAIYKDPKLGLQFEYPKSWKVRREKYSAVFEFSLESGLPVTVQLFSANYKDSADTYQQIQAEINRSMKRRVERQWQEEFLGVPMLLTKISYDEGGRAMSALTGLLYSRFAEKMNFRLTTRAESAEKAESAWHDVLLTLRTTTGDLPPEEDPNKPSIKPEAPKTVSVLTASGKPRVPEKGPVVVSLASSEKTFKLYLPKDWTVDKGRLRRPGLGGVIEIEAAVGLPEEAGAKLTSVAREALDQFTKVIVREDPPTVQARSGAIVGRVFRVGEFKGKQLAIGNIVASCEAVYVVLTYKCDSASTYHKDSAALKELCELLFAERA